MAPENSILDRLYSGFSWAVIVSSRASDLHFDKRLLAYLGFVVSVLQPSSRANHPVLSPLSQAVSQQTRTCFVFRLGRRGILSDDPILENFSVRA